MSLKTRLHLSIVGLVAILVVVLSLLNLQIAVSVEFQDVQEHAQAAAQQVKSLVVARVSERTAARTPPPKDVAELTRLWGQIIEQDRTLPALLAQTTANTRAAAEIVIYDARGRILSASNASRIGIQVFPAPDFADWDRKSLPVRLNEIFSRRRDYAVSVGLGIPDASEPLFTVQVLVSSVLLRGVVLPQIRALGVLSLVALGLSMVIAVIFSNVILRPMARMRRTIDRIVTGEGIEERPQRRESSEFVEMQSKLNLLGQQFRGARQDAMQLRTNVEQLFERLEEAVLLFDQDQKLMVAGKPAERFLGKGRWEILGQRLSEVFPESTALGSIIQTAVELHQPIKDKLVSLERNGASPAQVLVSVEPMENYPSRQLTGALITLRDAETRRQIESQLDLSTRLAAISRLTGGVAHEIKNPLNAIALHLEVLKSRLQRELPEPDPEIEVIAQEIRRLDRVVKTFLDFTRPVKLNLREVDLAVLVSEVLALVGPQCRRLKIECRSQIAPGKHIAQADHDLLKQAILNVVANAVEAMPEGGRLEVEVGRAGDDSVVIVSDTGPGIPPEIRDKIFNLYFTTKKSGSGIGLAMTFQVLQLHNGTIGVASEPGRGTTFTLQLPALRSA